MKSFISEGDGDQCGVISEYPTQARDQRACTNQLLFKFKRRERRALVENMHAHDHKQKTTQNVLLYLLTQIGFPIGGKRVTYRA